MERRFADRVEELLRDAQVDPRDWAEVAGRLEKFVDPFARLMTEPAQRIHLGQYAAGLLSNLRHKTGESIAYLHGVDRKQLQQFIGEAPWDHRPLMGELVKQVAQRIGEPGGVIVFDPTSFPKKGTKSVGVARQWSGRLGKVDNCQVSICMGYVSSHEHALVDYRLYLPEEWTKDRARCREAGVPDSIKFRTRHELALEMLDERGSQLPHRWVAGDDEMGRVSKFREKLRQRGERYLLAVPSNTTIRDLGAPRPAQEGQDQPRQAPWQQVAAWRESLPESAWVTITTRDAEKGPLVVDVTLARVQARDAQRRAGAEEVLVITREKQSDGSFKHDYFLSNAGAETSHQEFAQVANAEHRIEHCFERGKSEAGLGDYQVRNWVGWHHHQTLSLIAAWFLIEETRRGKNTDTRDDGSTSSGADSGRVGRAPASEHLAA